MQGSKKLQVSFQLLTACHDECSEAIISSVSGPEALGSFPLLVFQSFLAYRTNLKSSRGDISETDFLSRTPFCQPFRATKRSFL